MFKQSAASRGLQMKKAIVSATLLAGAVFLGLAVGHANAQVRFAPKTYAALAPSGDGARIPEGTRITAQNWQQYRPFMTIGLQALFSGRYPLRVGPQPEYTIEVGPTIHIPLAKKYFADTEHYSQGVKLRQVATGGYTVDNYTAGVPFPNPSGPDIATKLMYDVWYPYNPFLIQSRALIILADQYGNVTSSLQEGIIWRLNHLSDEGKPLSVYTPGYLEADRFVVILPEQSRYTAQLSLLPDDPAKVQEIYAFLPSLRRSLRLSSSARCAPLLGSDFVQDDNGSGFFFQAVNFSARLLGTRKVLTLAHETLAGMESDSFYLKAPLPGFATPKAGRWELRDSYIIDVQPLPAAGSYCYLHKVGYVDVETYALNGIDIYDRNSALWKTIIIYNLPRSINNAERVLLPEAWGGTVVDFQNSHITLAVSGVGNSIRVDGEADPELQDAITQASPAILSQIMK
jgi:hypothetical protein